MVKNATTTNSLGSTSHWTAAVRAHESVREDRLFDDPWAAALAGAEGLAWAANHAPDSLAPIITRRFPRCGAMVGILWVNTLEDA